MLHNYLGIVALFAFAGGISALFIFLSEKLGPRHPNAAKNMPYECGEKPFEMPVHRQAVKFYIAGMLFVLFDVELVFFFPWAVVYRKFGMVAFIEMLFFLLVLVLGFIYAWRKGALQWK